MSLTVPQLLVMLGAALLAIALFVPRARIEPTLPPVVVGASLLTSAQTSPQIEVGSAASWPLLVDADAHALDRDARRALIETLDAIGEAWCEPLLRAACAEERDEELAALARRALRTLTGNRGVAAA